MHHRRRWMRSRSGASGPIRTAAGQRRFGSGPAHNRPISTSATITMVERTPAEPNRSLGEERGLGVARRRLERLARTVGELMEKATQNERILRRFQQFELELLAVGNLEALLDCLLQQSLQHFKLDAVELWLFDPQGTLSELLPDTGQWPGLHWHDDDAALHALYPSGPRVTLATPLPAGVLAGRPLHSVALLPLARQGALVGSLHFGAFAAHRFSGDKSTDFIAHLASIVALCLESSINQARLHRLSLIDTLTRVANRRAFQLSIETEIARASRQREPLTLMFADLDHFKRVNDCYGHQVGDRVLHAVAQTIAAALRKTDHVCRYGGEEFALILPHCDRTLALEVAERIRRSVDGMRVDGDGDNAVPVSLSMGLTCWAEPGADTAGLAERLVGRADQAVYRAKSAGRNRIEFLPL
jgi:diguanylate cyclase (GGDEF)-like protein